MGTSDEKKMLTPCEVKIKCYIDTFVIIIFYFKKKKLDDKGFFIHYILVNMGFEP